MGKLIKDYGLPASVVYFTFQQGVHLEKTRVENLSRIQFQAFYLVNSDELTIRQVSGDPFIMDQLVFNVSGPSISNEEDPTFSIDVIKYAIPSQGLTTIKIGEFGKVICGRMVVSTCNPDDSFQIKFRYSVFEQERGYRNAVHTSR